MFQVSSGKGESGAFATVDYFFTISDANHRYNETKQVSAILLRETWLNPKFTIPAGKNILNVPRLNFTLVQWKSIQKCKYIYFLVRSLEVVRFSFENYSLR